jgi:hypothetical protein
MLLSKGDITVNEAKNFASKTILTNIQSILTDIKEKLYNSLEK